LRSLDHFAHAVRDLDQAGRAFERLGFFLLPAARHAELGSCNRVFQLGRTYYELVADLDRSLPLLRDRMMPRFQCGDGMAIVSLTSADLTGDRDAIVAAGLDPDPILNARRAITMPDGSADETNSHCFYVWRDAPRRYLTLFLSHHYKPETIFVPAYQRHPNGARNVTRLTYVSADPAGDRSYFSAMLGAPPTGTGANGLEFTTPAGETIEVLDPSRLTDRFGPAAPPWCDRLAGYGIGIDFATDDLDRCGALLAAADVPAVTFAGRLVVPASFAAGMVVSFSATTEHAPA
jgi:hypothetical protein